MSTYYGGDAAYQGAPTGPTSQPNQMPWSAEHQQYGAQGTHTQQNPMGQGQGHAYGYGPQYGQTVYLQQAPSNGMGVAGFVTGLLGLLLFWIPVLGLVLAALGVVLGSIGMSAGKKTGASTGLATTGFTLGVIALIPVIVVLAAVAS